MSEQRDAYKVLQVDPEADFEVIQAAYRRLAQKYHPDLAANGPDPDGAAIRMVEINAAWEHLRDPARRESYNRERGRPSAAPPPTQQPSPMPPPAQETPPFRTASEATTEGAAAAGPPPGRPSGSVMSFGRYSGWSLGEIGRVDPSYLEWLDRMPIGRQYGAEVDALLRKLGRRADEKTEATERRGLFRRR